MKNKDCRNGLPSVSVVAAAIIDGGKVLVAQRPSSDKAYKSFKWEFPGGKIEPEETEPEAIIREIHEELECGIEVEALLPEIEHEYPDFVLRLTLCICRLCPGALPRCLEHNAIRWCTPSALPDLDWAPADARCYPSVVSYMKGEAQ